MKNQELWKPTKYEFRKGRWRASRNPSEVTIGSRLIADTIARLYSSNLPRFAKGRLLDLGCGYVPFYGMYRDYVDDVVCADWENTPHPCPHLDVECDLTKRLPFADEAFDTIILSDVLEHIPNPESLWREMKRILRPQGVVLLNVPFFYWLHEMPHDYYRYTEFALRRFAQEVDFSIEELIPVGGVLEVCCDFFGKLVGSVPVVGRYGAALVQAVGGLALHVPFIAFASKKSAQRLPLGYFMVVRKPA